MASRTITIRGVPDETLERLRARSAKSRRSLNSELLVILERAAAADMPVDDVTAQPPATGQTLREPAPPVYGVVGSNGSDLLEMVDRDALAAVCRRHRIRWLAVFGSLARGDARPDSDADVVVEFEPGATPGLGIVRVAEALRTAFGGRRVDLVTRRELGRLEQDVLATARTLHGAG